MFAALCGVGSGVLGYMVGGALFTSTWKLMARSKSKEFHQVCYICKQRVSLGV